MRLDEVIKGWTEGVPLMTEGERTRFWIPENLAYEGKGDGRRGCSSSTSSWWRFDKSPRIPTPN